MNEPKHLQTSILHGLAIKTKAHMFVTCSQFEEEINMVRRPVLSVLADIACPTTLLPQSS